MTLTQVLARQEEIARKRHVGTIYCHMGNIQQPEPATQHYIPDTVATSGSTASTPRAHNMLTCPDSCLAATE